MPTTTPDGIVTPDNGWTGGFVQAMITMANTIQAIFARKAANSYSWANDTARNAQTGMLQGDTGTQTDIGVQFLYDGTRWNPTGISVSDTAAARDLRIPAGQRKQGMRVLTRDTMITWTYYELYNISTNPGGARAAGWLPADIFVTVQKSVDQNLTATAAPVTWDVEVSDLCGMHDNVTSNSQIIFPLLGAYEVRTYLFDTNTSGLAIASHRLNGATAVVGSFQRKVADAAAAPLLLVSTVVVTSMTDYLEALVNHATAVGVVNGGTTFTGASMTVTYKGRAA